MFTVVFTGFFFCVLENKCFKKILSHLVPPALAHCPGLGWYVYPGAISCNSFRSGPQIPQEGWSRCSSRQLWHDHKSHFSKASLSQVVRFRKAGSRWCQSLVELSLHRELPTAHCPGQSTERGGNHPMPIQSHVPGDKQGTGKSTEPPSCLPSPPCQDSHMVRGCLQLVGTGFDLSLPTLGKTRGSWIY